MASLNSLQIRALNAQTTGIRVTDSTPVAIRITHLGTNTLPVVATTASTIVLTDGVAGVNVTTITTNAGDATLGRAVDLINATTSWRAKILDGLRSTDLTTGSTLIVNATHTPNTKLGEFGYDVLLATSVAKTYAIRCTYDRTAKCILPSLGHRVKLVSFDYNLHVNAATSGLVKVYEWDAANRTETEVWAAASVTSGGSPATGASHDFSKAPITSKEGNDLVVVITDTTSITADAADNFMQVLYVRE